MKETMISAGIDVGTTTTQVIFSRFLIQETSGFGEIPKVEITEKEIIYRSPVHFTPFLDDDTIDGSGVREMVLEEYRQAGLEPKDLDSGAVIITGETAGKSNASQVLHHLAQIAGEFVVATAGPKLESVLAGKGSGAGAYSLETNGLVVNLDIGGGTTNICFFREGEVAETTCLDIGGRMIRVEQEKILSMTPKALWLAEKEGLNLEIGASVSWDSPGYKDLLLFTHKLADLLAEAIKGQGFSSTLEFMKTRHMPTIQMEPDQIRISGGVADCYYNRRDELFPYGDIGELFARALALQPFFQERLYKGKGQETVNATVIGAGNFSLELSGSTVEFTNITFPRKNIPVAEIFFHSGKMKYQELLGVLEQQMELGLRQFALSIEGKAYPSYVEIEEMAEILYHAYRSYVEQGLEVVIVLQQDMGKALGQALKRRFSRGTGILCIDHIACHTGDFIDIGSPVASGKAIPVVIKTLVFPDR